MDIYRNPKSVNRKVRFVAAYDYTFTLWHKRRYTRVMRSKAEGFSYNTTRSLHLRSGGDPFILVVPTR